jgi:hypothetical protein
MEDDAFTILPSQCIDSSRMLCFSPAETKQKDRRVIESHLGRRLRQFRRRSCQVLDFIAGIPEAPGAKTASHTLKRGRPLLAKGGLPHFRAQKPVFAPDDSFRKQEFEYSSILRFRMGDDLGTDDMGQTGICFIRRLVGNPDALVEVTHFAMELGDQEAGSCESPAQFVHDELATFQDALKVLRCGSILPPPIYVIESEQPHKKERPLTIDAC